MVMVFVGNATDISYLLGFLEMIKTYTNPTGEAKETDQIKKSYDKEKDAYGNADNIFC